MIPTQHDLPQSVPPQMKTSKTSRVRGLDISTTSTVDCRRSFEIATLADISDLIELATVSYAPGLLSACIETLHFHASCLTHGIDDGRVIFIMRQHGKAVGACGLHRYIWGSSTACWASWFFVHPNSRVGTVPIQLYKGLLNEAVKRGFRILCVETPSADPDYSSMQQYLLRLNFEKKAVLDDYYERGVNLEIYCLDLVDFGQD